MQKFFNRFLLSWALIFSVSLLRAEETHPVLDLSLLNYIHLRMSGASPSDLKKDLKIIKEARGNAENGDEENDDLNARQKLAEWLSKHHAKTLDPCEVVDKVFKKDALPEELENNCEGYDPAARPMVEGVAVASLESIDHLTLDRAREAAILVACGLEAAPAQKPFEGKHLRENWRWAVGLPIDEMRFSASTDLRPHLSNPVCELFTLKKLSEGNPKFWNSATLKDRCEKDKAFWSRAHQTLVTSAEASKDFAWLKSYLSQSLLHSRQSECEDDKLTIADYFACSFETYRLTLLQPLTQSQAGIEIKRMCQKGTASPASL